VNFVQLSPEIAMAVLALTLVVADLFTSDKSKTALAYLAVIGLIVPATLVVLVGRTPGLSFSDTLAVDPLSTLF